MSADRLEDDETALVRSTAAQIARRCRAQQTGGQADHSSCWRALSNSGFSEMRMADEHGSPLATASQTAAVIEELARSVCGGQLLGHLLAAELLRLSGARLPVELAGSAQPMSVALDAGWRDIGGPGTGVAWDSASSAWAVGVANDKLTLLDLGERIESADLSRGLHCVSKSRGSVIGSLSYPDVRDRYLSFARTMLTADLAGCAAGILDDALGYVQGRFQFGVPIGSFQAVQHICASAFVLVEAMRSSLLFANLALDGTDDKEAWRTSLVAKSFAGSAAVEVVEAAIQVFGGIAVTWEFPAHRHLRRALADREAFGSEETLNALLVTPPGERS